MELTIDLSTYTPEQRRAMRRFLRDTLREFDKKVTREGTERKPVTLEELGL